MDEFVGKNQEMRFSLCHVVYTFSMFRFDVHG